MSARSAAANGRLLVEAHTPMAELWRHVVLQLLDDYQSQVRRLGVAAASTIFDEEPPRTGDTRVDAALAALAEHLARRDGWRVPTWARDPDRRTLDWWFVDDLPALQAFALRESPLAFRKRGVFIGDGGLLRV